MKTLRNTFYVLALILVCCKKPYNPPVSSSPNSYLVVEGIINSGNDSTVIKLSKTVKLTDSVTTNPVLGANVTVEGEQGGTYPLYDANNNGHYNSVSGLNLSPSQKYRLRIQINSSQYLSDFVEVKATPPIDSVGYTLQNGNVNLYVNAHDPNNNTRYYRWDYDETWRFHSKYGSASVLNAARNAIVARTADQMIYYCFATRVSPNILLSSTEKLEKDVVYQSPLTQFALTSEKAELKYSILVRQYAITKEAYEFYQNIKKNTEQLGSVFDAQPSQITGNIHSVTNPAEPVVGYITASTVQTKRIFISHGDLPGDVQPIYPYDCQQDTAWYSAPKTMENQVQNTLINPPIDYIPTVPILSGPVIVGYLYSTIQCTDCTIRGAKQAPAWWQ